MSVESWKASPQARRFEGLGRTRPPLRRLPVWFSDLENIRLCLPALISLSLSKLALASLKSPLQEETLHRAEAPDTSPLSGHL